MNKLRCDIKNHLGLPALALSGALLLTSGAVLAGASEPPWSQASHVTDTVDDNNDDTWTYGYTVFNDAFVDFANGAYGGEPLIVDWELPYFADAGITDIVSPNDLWDYAIETIGEANPLTGWDGVAAWQNPSDPFYEGADSPYTTATQVLHWYNVCWAQPTPSVALFAVDSGPSCEGFLDGAIFPDNSLAGFGFTAGYSPIGAPYQASWAFRPIQTGDPAFPLGGIPASPLAVGTQSNPTIPEPAALALFGLGLAGLGLSRRRRQK